MEKSEELETFYGDSLSDPIGMLSVRILNSCKGRNSGFYGIDVK